MKGVQVELKEFVAETLRQIIEGVTTAQGLCPEANISPLVGNLVESSGAAAGLVRELSTGAFIQQVAFDVAVVVSEEKGRKGGAGILVKGLGLGGEMSAESANSTTSRIAFKVPLILPGGSPTDKQRRSPGR
jgi:hypothetical protein